MRLFVEISGITPLLMNRFNIDDQKKAKDKDLTPREQARKLCYLDDEDRLYYPTTNIYSCIMEAGRFHKDGKSKITTARSSLIPAGLMIEDEIVYFMEPETWEVDSRAVVVPATGGRIVAHRPRLDNWKLRFVLLLDVKVFSPKLIRVLVDDAGKKVGLGDYRPARKGIFGRFVVSSWEEKAD